MNKVKFAAMFLGLAVIAVPAFGAPARIYQCVTDSMTGRQLYHSYWGDFEYTLKAAQDDAMAKCEAEHLAPCHFYDCFSQLLDGSGVRGESTN